MEESASSPSAKPPRKVGRRLTITSSIEEPNYAPPDFSKSRQTRIGSSFIEQFVAGHNANDVLRELVQNEYDGGGGALTLTFGSRSLEVAGTGRNIDRSGWDRLSVIVGTGNVMGTQHAERVNPKENGIGTKNFGLRSLFRFGDEIHVRSGGQVALLDLQTQETARERDPAWQGEKGVRVHVPYRQKSTEILEAFSIEREEHALQLIAAGLPDTLVKLALGGKKRGLRKVDIHSLRTGQILRWKQDAKRGHCRVTGVTLVVRRGRLDYGEKKRVLFQEEEFSRAIAIPAEHEGRRFPAYYKLPGGRLKIAVSVPIARGRIDLKQNGHFYYPLKAPSSGTGFVVSVSGPFELNTDRSGINDHVWNDWLIDKAVELTVDLLKTDWFSRYGADAFKAVIGNGPASPDRFSSKLAQQLENDACWPTQAKGDDHFASASEIVLPAQAIYEGFLGDKRYLDPALARDKAVCDLVEGFGAKPFTLSSLVRLRCSSQNTDGLATKLGNDADFYFTDYRDTVADVEMQKRFAFALSAYPRRLTKQHKADLGNTSSTLSATGELKPASQLMIVDHDLWTDCPEPERNRLHPELVPYKAISAHCRRFDEDQWLIDAANRSATEGAEERERETLYRKLLTRRAPISRRVLTALRNNPVVKNQRGDWVCPVDMVHFGKPLVRLLGPAIDAPSKEMFSANGLIARLRIREKLNGFDLVRYARSLGAAPERAGRFEKLLADNLKLLNSKIVREMKGIAFLKARSGRLMNPERLHLDTAANRLCVDDEDLIVGGANEILYRKLGLKTAPGSDTLLSVIETHRQEGTAPPRPDILYPTLVEAIKREGRSKTEIADLPICWVQGDYYSPSHILVGSRIAVPLAEAIPLYRYSDEVGRAYQYLGAPSHSNDDHWARFFGHVGAVWASDPPLDARRRRILLEAYNIRGAIGLPQGLEEIRCLIDDKARFFTSAQLSAGKLVEPDFQALEEALRAANSTIGIVDRSARSRIFFGALGILPLSAVAGTGVPILGAPGLTRRWYDKHCERSLALFHRPLFARALHEVAYRFRHNHPGYLAPSFEAIEGSLSAIKKFEFVQTIDRRYSVGGTSVLVPTQAAVKSDRIALVAPPTKNSFQLQLADALAEIVGAGSVAAMRGMANAILPLVLCSTQKELTGYLARMGIRIEPLSDTKGGEDFLLDIEEDDDDAEELALLQVFETLETGGSSDAEPVQPSPPPSATPKIPQQTTSVPSAPVELPEIDEVSLIVATTSGTEIESRNASGGSGGSSGSWLPPTPAEVERAGALGKRGEELVYRTELQKVREWGYPEPERYVIWTSQDEPGADHDIRSIDAQGRPRWIEVKSTTGVDGRFEWSRKEFEKALRERSRYELWRVYRVGEGTPVAKCFPDPARMLGKRQIVLELGMLRANIEGVGN